MERVILFFALFIFSFSTSTYAQEAYSGEEAYTKEIKSFYLGAGLSMANFSDSTYQDDNKPDSTLLGVIFGYQPFSFLAIEGREFVRVSSKDERIKWYGSVVSKWLIPIDYHFNIFGTLGYAGVKHESVNDDDLKWAPTVGAGLRFRNKSPLMLDLEVEYLDESAVAPAGDDGVVSFNLNVYYAF
ncbi:hypothetical protein L4C33_22195 [Vibrio makurazakiensis]|uniref:outer membrane beta-barrel protein n=1 Tax=Vibrio makurazakiensis TaxID=2910250 RepID=UPI003D09A937